MIDLFLRTVTEQELIDALPFARGEEGWLKSTHDYALDVIGDLYNKDGVYNEDGYVVTPPTKIAGFHANIRCTEEIANIIPGSIKIVPMNPMVVWFDA